MTGHQEHPGTGISAQGKETRAVELEPLIRGIGVSDVKVVDAFNLKALRTGVRASLDSPELSVIIVRGACSVRGPKRSEPRVVDSGKCDRCGTCLFIGCPAIQSEEGGICIDAARCVGDACTLCQQLCPQKAIVPQSQFEAVESK